MFFVKIEDHFKRAENRYASVKSFSIAGAVSEPLKNNCFLHYLQSVFLVEPILGTPQCVSIKKLNNLQVEKKAINIIMLVIEVR